MINSFETLYSSQRMVLKDVLPLELPLCISLEASDICNFKCVMCCHGNPEYNQYAHSLTSMELSLFKKCVNDITTWCSETGKKVKVIKLYSLGEPLVNPNIVEMVRIVKKADICELLEITSNSSLLTESVGKGLVDCGLDIFRASIYSVDEKRNKEITQSIIHPQTIADNIRKMKEYRDAQGKTLPFISAKMIDSYSDENEVFLKKYRDIADEVYIDKIMDSSGTGETIKAYYQDKCEEAMNDNARTRIFKSRRSCRYPFTHMTVKSDGQVIICCADWKNKTVIGNVNEKSLQDIWNSKELYDFRCMTLMTKGAGNELCRTCEIPLRDLPEDDVDGISIKRFSYKK